MSQQTRNLNLTPGMGAGATLREGRYHLRRKLGQGGMGSVYLAEDALLPGRLVAVKENTDAGADAQAQFRREALLLARLRHPNLPQVTDYFIEADGRQYLVMDYVPGENLAEMLQQRQGPFPTPDALAIVEQVMQALAYMHTWRDPDSGQVRPIIHRDIKPANIKRTPEGRVFLVDFGIAKVESGGMTGTAVSAKALTPGYAPLEQYGGGTDARSDIYSLGATLYALLTGKAPPSATDMAMASTKQPAPVIGALKGAPSAVAKVVERAMRTLPADRYQSIGRDVSGALQPATAWRRRQSARRAGRADGAQPASRLPPRRAGRAAGDGGAGLAALCAIDREPCHRRRRNAGRARRRHRHRDARTAVTLRHCCRNRRRSHGY
jgi:serine/threonine protein kinase